MHVKLLLFTFYLNCTLHAVSIEKPFEWMTNFGTVQFSKTEPEPNFTFPHIPTVLLLCYSNEFYTMNNGSFRIKKFRPI